MRILVVTQYFWPENFRINDLVLGLQQRGHRVTVLTGIPNYPGGRFFPGYGFFAKRKEDYQGVKVLRVPMLARGKKGAARLFLNYLSFAFSASLFAPFLCRDEYDAIFVYEPSPITVGLPALALKRLKKLPLLFWVQDLWPESLSATGAVKSARILEMVEKLVRHIYRRCDLILVQSEAFIPSIEKLGVGRDRIVYFPNSAEDVYQSGGLPEDSVVIPEGFRVMFAGNIGVAQDFGTILDAAERLKPYPDIKWLILGDGRMSHWVKEQIGARGLEDSVHLLGRHDVGKMPWFFSRADVMLVTLKKEPIFALTIPSKVQSYLACGKPIVAALDGEGGRVIEEADAGVVVASEDAKGLADAVLRMYRMPCGEREAMGMNGLRYFQANFERTMLLDRLEAWFHEKRELI